MKQFTLCYHFFRWIWRFLYYSFYFHITFKDMQAKLLSTFFCEILSRVSLHPMNWIFNFYSINNFLFILCKYIFIAFPALENIRLSASFILLFSIWKYFFLQRLIRNATRVLFAFYSVILLPFARFSISRLRTFELILFYPFL